MGRHRFRDRSLVAVTLTLLAACQGSDKSPSDSPGETDVQPDTDTDAGTDTDTLPPGPDNRRPLCKVEGPAPTVAADLAAWAAGIRADDNRFYGQAPAEALEALGETLGSTSTEIVETRIVRGWYRLREGRIDDAIADLQAALTLAEAEVPQWRPRARQILAGAWMRKAELDNCVSDGSGHACLVPFDEQGLHIDPLGASSAATLYMERLVEDDPSDFAAAWLYNVAHMALGDYPDGVDPEWLVDPAVMMPEAELPAWTNVSPALGLAKPTLAGGAAVEDMDGDGLLDVLVSSMEPGVGMDLYLNQGDGHFCDASEASGVSAITASLDFFTADYDNDGDMDVLATRGAWQGRDGFIRPSLLNNDGTGRFTDVATAAGVAVAVGPAQAAAWGDVNNDGWLDVFLGRERISGTTNAPSSLFINQGDGTFVDTAVAAGVADPGYVKGAALGDIDNDGDLDLYASNMAGPNHMYRNRGDGTFSLVAWNDDVAMPESAFATGFFDYDHDGNLDLYVSAFDGIAFTGSPLEDRYGDAARPYAADLLGRPHTYEHLRLYRNTGSSFEDVTEAVGLDDVHATMGVNFADLDADGWLDLYLGTGAPAYEALEPNTAYRNDAGRRFLDVTSAVHLGHLQKGHAVAFGDLDEDGDEDLLAEIGGAYPGDRFPNALFINPTADVHAITLRLEGVACNRGAVGARVRLVTPTRTLHHVVGTGASFGANSHQVEVALGAETTIVRVEIDWPGGATEIVEGLEIGTVVNVRQGEGMVASRPMARIAIEIPEAPGHP